MIGLHSLTAAEEEIERQQAAANDLSNSTNDTVSLTVDINSGTITKDI